VGDQAQPHVEVAHKGLDFFVDNCCPCRCDRIRGTEIVHVPYCCHKNLDLDHTTHLFRSRCDEEIDHDLIDIHHGLGDRAVHSGVHCRGFCSYPGCESCPFSICPEHAILLGLDVVRGTVWKDRQALLTNSATLDLDTLQIFHRTLSFLDRMVLDEAVRRFE
jgi:hypothetical protein